MFILNNDNNETKVCTGLYSNVLKVEVIYHAQFILQYNRVNLHLIRNKQRSGLLLNKLFKFNSSVFG